MIKPASYWALHKTADAVLLGRIGLALADREDELTPPLNAVETALVNVIKQDSDWMDERVDEQKKRWADRQRQKRERERDTQMSRDVTPVTVTPVTPPMSRDVTPVTVTPVTPPMSRYIRPSVPPSVPPVPKGTIEEDVVNACARRKSRAEEAAPSLDEVLHYAADEIHHPKFDEAWAREWYQFMCASVPPFTDKNGRIVRNWRQKMITAWSIREQHLRAVPKAAASLPGTDPDGIRRGSFAIQTANKIGLD